MLGSMAVQAGVGAQVRKGLEVAQLSWECSRGERGVGSAEVGLAAQVRMQRS